MNKGASQYVKLFGGNEIGNLTFWIPLIQIDVLCDQSDIFILTCLMHFTQSSPVVLQSISGLPNTRATKKLCAALSNQNTFK